MDLQEKEDDRTFYYFYRSADPGPVKTCKSHVTVWKGSYARSPSEEGSSSTETPKPETTIPDEPKEKEPFHIQTVVDPDDPKIGRAYLESELDPRDDRAEPINPIGYFRHMTEEDNEVYIYPDHTHEDAVMLASNEKPPPGQLVPRSILKDITKAMDDRQADIVLTCRPLSTLPPEIAKATVDVNPNGGWHLDWDQARILEELSDELDLPVVVFQVRNSANSIMIHNDNGEVIAKTLCLDSMFPHVDWQGKGTKGCVMEIRVKPVPKTEATGKEEEEKKKDKGKERA